MQIVDIAIDSRFSHDAGYAESVTTTTRIPAERISEALLGSLRAPSMGQLRRGFGARVHGEADTQDLHAITVAQIHKLVESKRIDGRLSRAQIIALVRRVGRFQTLKLVERIARRERVESAYAGNTERHTKPSCGIEIELGETDMLIARMRAAGMHISEIALRVQLSETAVTTRLLRMRERLADEHR